MDDDKQTIEMVLDLAGGEWRFQITRDAARNSMRALAKGLGLELIELAAGDDVASVRRLARERDEALDEWDEARKEIDRVRQLAESSRRGCRDAIRQLGLAIAERNGARVERDQARAELATATAQLAGELSAHTILGQRDAARLGRDEAQRESEHWRAQFDSRLESLDPAIKERDQAQADGAVGKDVMDLRDAELAQVRAERDRILGGYLTLSDLAAQMWCTARKLEEDRNGFRDRDGKAKP